MSNLKRIYPAQNETYAVLYMDGNKKRKQELGHGNSYLSQSSRSIIVAPGISKVELYNGNGIKTRELSF